MFCCCLSIYAQDNLYHHDLDEEKLESLRETIKHNSKTSKQWTYKNKKEWERANRENSGDKIVTQGTEDYKTPQSREPISVEVPTTSAPMGMFGQVILYIILGAVIAFLIYILFVNSDFKANGKKYKSIHEVDDLSPSEIPLTELERLLKVALASKDYRGAIRIYYLFILKDLSEKNWINWEKEKTNMHYIIEMKNKKEGEQFNTVVNYFEFIWYGKRHISQSQFQSIQPNFTSLLKQLGIK